METKLCRLCAKLKRPEELKVSIKGRNSRIKQKLIDCCRWNQFRKHKNLPKKVCKSCIQKLEKCWAFAETVASAQKILLDGIYDDEASKYVPIVSINEGHPSAAQENILSSIPNQNVLVKQEFSEEFSTSYTVDHSTSIDVKNEVMNEIENESDKKHFNGNDFNDFIQQFPSDNYVCNEVRKEERKKRKVGNMKKGSLDFDILSLLSANDLNKNGTIKLEKILELHLSDWSIYKYKCWKCSNLFDDIATLKGHMSITHPNDTLRHICSLCSHQRTYRDNHRGMFSQHIIREHFPHLKYW